MSLFKTDNRKQVRHLIQSGNIANEHIDDVLVLADISPNHQDWKRFFDYLFLFLGGIAVVSAVSFFIAYNWDEMGRFAKFGLVELLIASAVGIYWKNNHGHQKLIANTATPTLASSKSLISQIALLAASLLVGVLLAFYGQTYQTGADPWQLFFVWAMLIIPWAIIARLPSLWILWLALVNLSIVLYYQTFGGVLHSYLSSDHQVLWLFTIINTIVLVIWEFIQYRKGLKSSAWATSVILIAAGAPLTTLVVQAIFSSYSHLFAPAIFWALLLVSLFIFYRCFKPHLLMLAMGCFSGIIVIISVLTKLFRGNDVGVLLLLAMATIGLGVGSAVWLRKVHQEFNNREDDDQESNDPKSDNPKINNKVTV